MSVHRTNADIRAVSNFFYSGFLIGMFRHKELFCRGYNFFSRLLLFPLCSGDLYLFQKRFLQSILQ
jgi:hypothetical protein